LDGTGLGIRHQFSDQLELSLGPTHLYTQRSTRLGLDLRSRLQQRLFRQRQHGQQQCQLHH
jgi:hypothetical protein